MKKFVSIALSLVLVLSCAAALAELTFSTGGTAGTYYAYGTVLAQYITANTDLAVTAIAGNGSAANIDLLDLGDAQLALVQNDVAGYAYNGIRFEQYEGAPVNSFTALAALYDETVQVITCNPDIKTVADLKGKNVSIGSAGSGTFFNAMDFLAAYDMTIDDIVPQYLSFGDSAESLKDGKIDAAFVVAGAPTPAVTDLATTKGAYLVALDDEHAAKLVEINPAYGKTVIPGGTYEGIDTDTVTVGVKATIIAGADVSDEDAYTIVSTIFENKDAITEAHAKGAELSLEFATDGIAVPFAKGAAQYYAENGITVDTVD